ncbi:uncharacterized protein RCC_08028 [Ramularia collo-cygni]|uniref:Uncharacterized protein n=1 Tax=Ramularia collo-cygni TaxID=112498 RepID=A0A2D3VJB0_9PEZI|nr:uncharacterized protein RCC_08028 [Ramularia collo-cygni]CZT22159.1 uncharacterized protein RCC_08028 [Ramularia collo-cygni]
MVLRELDPDDALQLSLALQFQYSNGSTCRDKFLFNHIEIIQRMRRTNMLRNTSFSTTMNSDGVGSRIQSGLCPLQASYLPPNRAYHQLIHEPSFTSSSNAKNGEEKTEHLCFIRYPLLFRSLAFRDGVDAPLERSRIAVKLAAGSNVTYAQLLQTPPNEWRPRPPITVEFATISITLHSKNRR